MDRRTELLWLLSCMLFLFGCANKVVPTGGPKDVTPPVLLKAEPENNTVNFTSKTIILTFDEYIQLKDIGKQLVVSPPIKPAPVMEIRKKSIIIELGDSLQPNTTYNINFGDAVADNNEGNPLPGFRYVFSTGSEIDSLRVTGKIVDALTKKPQEGALALLYDLSVSDSLLLKSPPGYFSRTDKNGVFQILNVRPGQFRLFALSEKNSNYIFDQPDELVGFSAELINLKDSVVADLGIYKQISEKQAVKSGNIQDPGVLVTVFSRPVSSISWVFPDASFEKVIPEYSAMGDTVYLYLIPPPGDTLSAIWYENGVTVDTVKYQQQRGRKAASVKKNTGYTAYPMRGAGLAPETTPFIKWWAPLSQIDSSKIIFKKDSVLFPASMSFADSLKTQMNFFGDWKEGSYFINILPGAVTDIYNNTNDSVNTGFTFPPEKTKGSISFKFMMLQPGNHLLQLVNDKDELVRQRRFEDRITGIFELVDPGTYRLRVITDSNNNGRWDGGNYRINILPEEVRYYSEALVVRSNWEVEVEWVK